MQTARLPKSVRKARVAVQKGAAAVDLLDPKLYINRELSLLSFQRRVLEEALDESNPLLERVKFLSILGSNLDEVYMVRVAGLIEQAEAGISERASDGMSPRAQLVAIRREVRRLLSDAHKCFAGRLLPALAENGIRLVDYDDLSESQRKAAAEYFNETVFPILTPLAFDPGRPFPHISNLSLNLAAVIEDAGGLQHFARVKTPGSLPQVVRVSRRKAGKHGASRNVDTYVWLEQVIAANLQALFPGLKVLESHAFHVTRDADIDIKELEAEDLLETVEEGVRQRRFASVIRLEVHQEMPRHILSLLTQNLEITSKQVYRIKGLLGLSRLISLYQLDRPDLKYKTFVPRLPVEIEPTTESDDIFSAIRRNDILVHHPFDSFQPVIDVLAKAARDPDVLAIKIVLYRVGRNSPVVQALLDAIEEGKQVAVLMELKARFDEESNIEWARALERAGVHVVYGLLGLKSHCKVALIVRREGDRIRRYVHLSTGNYNAVTAHMYTDVGLFTVDEDIASDATDLFNYLTGYSLKNDYRKMLVSPITLRRGFERLIEREIAHQKAGRRGRLIFKTNSLVDGQIIRLLYEASQAGVEIDLLVRGMCCLTPQVPGVSENIRVTSIVGRFLEHSRIYYFRNGGKEEVYLGSADLMPRNLDRRVEVLFPVCSERLRERLKTEVLELYLRDNVKARRMTPAGAYNRPAAGKRAARINAQELLIPPQPQPSTRTAVLPK